MHQLKTKQASEIGRLIIGDKHSSLLQYINDWGLKKFIAQPAIGVFNGLINALMKSMLAQIKYSEANPTNFLQLQFTIFHYKPEGLSLAGTYLSGAPLQGRLMPLSINIRLGWKGLLRINALAYCKKIKYGRKKFIGLAPDLHI